MDPGMAAFVYFGSVGLSVTAVELAKSTWHRYRNGEGNGGKARVKWEIEVGTSLKNIEKYTEATADRLRELGQTMDRQGHVLTELVEDFTQHCSAQDEHRKEMHDLARDVRPRS